MKMETGIVIEMEKETNTNAKMKIMMMEMPFQELEHSPITVERLLDKTKDAMNLLLSVNFKITDIKTMCVDKRDLSDELFSNDFHYFYLMVISRLSKGVDGYFIIITDMASSDELSFLLTGRHTSIVNEFEESIFKEVCNVMAGTFVSELANRTGTPIDYTIPGFTINATGELIELIEKIKSLTSNKIQVIRFTLSCDMPQIDLLNMIVLALR